MNRPKIHIRAYCPNDARALVNTFYHTIHTVNAKDYSQEQREAWAPSSRLQLQEWKEKWARLPPLVATYAGNIVGFAEFESRGYIDGFYCHHAWIGQGVGSALMQSIESHAIRLNVPRLFAKVSITAKPFFAAKGFVVVEEQTIKIRGVDLSCFLMQKVMKGLA